MKSTLRPSVTCRLRSAQTPDAIGEDGKSVCRSISIWDPRCSSGLCVTRIRVNTSQARDAIGEDEVYLNLGSTMLLWGCPETSRSVE